MVFYLMDKILLEEIKKVKVMGKIVVVKLYFVGVIINLDLGVILIKNIYLVFEVM